MASPISVSSSRKLIISLSLAKESYSNSGNSFFTKYGKTRMAGGPFQFKKDYELNNGTEKFLIKELEVFQVKIDETLL